MIGEPACGTLRNRRGVQDLLGRLPAVPTTTHVEALDFLERRDLAGRGIGFIDVHLLASAPSPPQRSCGPATGRLAVIATELALA